MATSQAIFYESLHEDGQQFCSGKLTINIMKRKRFKRM